MSDDLSPAEQARAHRLSAGWLIGAGFNTGAGVFVVRALFDHADTLAPIESVESLRAERDELVLTVAEIVTERNRAEQDAEAWEEKFLDADSARYNAVAERDAARAAVRKWEDVANGWLDRVVELRASHAQCEAARGRCARED